MAANSEKCHLQKTGVISRVALSTFFNIVTEWGLSSKQAMLLLGIGEKNSSTFYRWKKHPERAKLSKDKLERISYVLGIYKDLAIIYPTRGDAIAWIHRPNKSPLFNGQPALKRMLGGNVSDLFEVRRHLDARANIW